MKSDLLSAVKRSVAGDQSPASSETSDRAYVQFSIAGPPFLDAMDSDELEAICNLYSGLFLNNHLITELF